MYLLDDYRWLHSEPAKTFWKSIVGVPPDQSSQVLKLAKAQFPSHQANLIALQFELLPLARRKFDNPHQWSWTKQLLEQASDQWTSLETALDFPIGSHVMDVCCGAGADSAALNQVGLSVTSIDQCPIACELTRQNMSVQHRIVQVVEASAQQMSIEQDSYINIDPDRRVEGRRITNLDSMSPSWQCVEDLIDRSQGLSLKLSPGLRIDWKSGQHEGPPPDTVRYLSKDGSVRQQRWLWGLNRWPKGTVVISAFVKSPTVGWVHESFESSVDTSIYGVATERIGSYVADYDPAIRAAEVGVPFAQRFGWQLLSSSSGYFTSNEPIKHPMTRTFQVLQTIPMDLRKLKALARTLRPKVWELKSRGVEIDLDSLRKSLTTDPSSEKSLCVLFTKIGKSYRAIICERC
jgi:SAM-dependent methyltransferase